MAVPSVCANNGACSRLRFGVAALWRHAGPCFGAAGARIPWPQWPAAAQFAQRVDALTL